MDFDARARELCNCERCSVECCIEAQMIRVALREAHAQGQRSIRERAAGVCAKHHTSFVFAEAKGAATVCGEAIRALPIEGDDERKPYSPPAIDHTEDL